MDTIRIFGSNLNIITNIANWFSVLANNDDWYGGGNIFVPWLPILLYFTKSLPSTLEWLDFNFWPNHDSWNSFTVCVVEINEACSLTSRSTHSKLNVTLCWSRLFQSVRLPFQRDPINTLNYQSYLLEKRLSVCVNKIRFWEWHFRWASFHEVEYFQVNILVNEYQVYIMLQF